MLALAAGALAGLAYLEPRRPDPLIEFGLFRSAPFSAAILSAVCGIAALAGFGFLSTLYLQDVRGMSTLRAGLTVGPMAAEMAVCAPLAGRLIARRGARLPAVIAGAALAASSVALSRLTGGSSPAFLSVTYSLFGIGAGLLNPAVTHGVMSAVPDGQAGVGSGINSSSRQLGQCLGVAVTGTVLACSLHGPMQSGFLPAARDGWLVMAGCGLCVLAAGLAGTARQAGRPAARHARPTGLLPSALPLIGRRGAPPTRPGRPRQLPRTAGPSARHARSRRRSGLGRDALNAASCGPDWRVSDRPNAHRHLARASEGAPQ